MSKKILIADDHPTIRNGVKSILTLAFSDVIFGEAATAAETQRMIREKKWDALILDMDMPGRSGLEVLQQMNDEGIKIPTLVFSMHDQKQIAVRVLRLGAYGFLSKDVADKELAEAVRHLLAGRKYISQQLADMLAEYVANPENKPPHELLSGKEYQTFILIGKGRTISEIANELSLSPSTISTFRTRILEKMNMKNSAELVKYCTENKLV